MNNNESRVSHVDALLQQLPQLAENSLSDLTAGPQLKARILYAAAEQKMPRTRILSAPVLRWASVACCAAVMALALVMGTTFLNGGEEPSPLPAELITSNTLGDSATAAPPVSGDLGSSGVVISPGNANPGYRSIWAPASGGSFPLIGVNGRYYRMLTTPRNVSSSLRGSSVGTVTEFTTEPSLAGTDTVLSNVVDFGETVYAVRGMDGALVTAQVDGQMRLFQRVSFNGNALRGRESFSDTLRVNGSVVAMELTGVGTITDPSVCRQLMNILFDCAGYESSGSVSSRQSLLLEMDNGLVLQLAVKSDSVAACGVWSCPEFFEAFEDACN